MKKLLVCLVGILLAYFSSTVWALTYTVSQITPDGITAKQPAINDCGEIVWLQYRPDHSEQDWEVFSSLHGQITDVPGSVNELEIGNNGEIVWTVSVGDGFPNPDYHTHVFSSLRGQISSIDGFNHTHPDVNINGEIIWVQNGDVYSNTRDYITSGLYDGNANPAINDIGEIVWEQQVGGVRQIFSNEKGQLTSEDANHYLPSLNDDGELVWQQISGYSFQQIVSNLNGLITSGDGPDHRWPDINNHGEIVWESLGKIFKATPVPEPSPAYTVTDLGTLGGSFSHAEAINNNGQVVGWSFNTSNEKRAFLWKSETVMLDLGTLGGNISAAYDINDLGIVVGESTTAASQAPHAFLYDGEMHDLGTLGGDVSLAFGINNIGHVAGDSNIAGGNRYAFLYDGDEMHNLGCLGDTSCQSYGTNINDYDQVVGYTTNPFYAFLYDNGEMQDIGTLGGESVVAHDINNYGMVVGTAETTSGPWHAFIFDGNEIQDLGTLDCYGSTAWGINNLGEVVGDLGVPSGVSHAFLWDSLNGMQDLNDLIPAHSGWELRSAQDINDVGQIVGYGGIDLDDDGTFDERHACGKVISFGTHALFSKTENIRCGMQELSVTLMSAIVGLGTQQVWME
jgi:probable HAF family extracellular repeat protein